LAEAAAVAQAASIELGPTQRIVVGGFEILLCNFEGKLYAIEDVCTHDGAPLDQGELEGRRITCPRHGAVFDVITGAVLALPAVLPVRTFVVKVMDGEVYIELPNDGPADATAKIEHETRDLEHVPTKLDVVTGPLSI
jgi:3-phenylpropionate/trans-cinnamate dioxygenase ferredoxin component